jgi:hypothetical protein
MFFQVLFILFDVNYKKKYAVQFSQKVKTGAEKTQKNKTEWGGWTLFEPGCPFRPRRK